MIEAINPGYQVFGTQAIYTDRDYIETECTVVVSFDLTRWGDSISITSEQCVINVRRSEVPNRPRRGESFTLVDGREYRAEQVLQATEYEFLILALEQ